MKRSSPVTLMELASRSEHSRKRRYCKLPSTPTTLSCSHTRRQPLANHLPPEMYVHISTFMEYRDCLSLRETCRGASGVLDTRERKKEATVIAAIYSRARDDGAYASSSLAGDLHHFLRAVDTRTWERGVCRAMAKLYKYWYRIIRVEDQDEEMYLDAFSRRNFIDSADDITFMYTACWTTRVMVKATRVCPQIVLLADYPNIPPISYRAYRIAGAKSARALLSIPVEVYHQFPSWTERLVCNDAEWEIAHTSLAMFPPGSLTPEQIETAYSHGIKCRGARHHEIRPEFLQCMVRQDPNVATSLGRWQLTDDLLLLAFRTGLVESAALSILDRMDSEPLACALVQRDPTLVDLMRSETLTEPVLRAAFVQDGALVRRILYDTVPTHRNFLPQITDERRRSLLQTLSDIYIH